MTLAICERDGVAGQFWRRLAAHGAAIDEGFAILERLHLGQAAERPTRTLPYGQQRLLEIALALATRPKVLLLDEPAAGVPKDESAALFAVIAALPADISVLFIEHDMDIVFSFASRIIVLVAGGVLLEADPATVRSDPARPRGLSRPGGPCLSRCWSFATSARATARPWCSTACRSPCRPTAASRCSGATGSARPRCS